MVSKPQQPDDLCTMPIFIALFFFQIILSGCHTKPATRSHQGTDTSKVVFHLPPNQKVTNKLTGGKIHAYAIPLLRDQFLRVVVIKPKAILTVRLIDPSGLPLQQHTVRCYGVLPLSSISQNSGTFTLEVQPEEERQDAPSYEIVIEPVREESPEADNRLLADKAFAEAERLRTQWSQDAFVDTLSQYTRALQYWQALNDQGNQATALLSIAELYYEAGKNREALNYYNQAIGPSQNSQQTYLEIEAFNGIAMVSIELGDIPEALRRANLARDLSLTAGSITGEAQALSNIGLSYYLTGEAQKAIGYFEQALIKGRADSDPRSQAQAFINLGYSYQDIGEMQEASNYYSQALTLFQSINDRRREGLTLTALGNVASFLNDKQEALKRHTQSLHIFQQIGDLNGEAAALNGLGYVYDDLGERPKALAAFEHSLQLSHTSGNRGYECQTLGYIGRVHHASGDKHKALEVFEQKLKLSRQIGDRRIEAHTLRDIGSTLHSMNRKYDALRHYEQALSLSRVMNDRRGQAYTLDYIGYIHDTSENKRKALAYYSRALTLMRAVEDSPGQTLTLYNIARANCDMGNLSQARLSIEEALYKVEPPRKKVISQEWRTSYFASTHQYYELYIDVLMRLHKRAPRQGLSAVAFEMSEKARARTLRDSLAEAGEDIRQGVDPGLLERERVLQKSLNTKADLRIRTLSSKHTDEQVEQLEREINNLLEEFNDVQAQIRDKSPSYGAMTELPPLFISDIQRRLLDSDTVLLEYSLGDRASYLWAVTANSIDGYRLPSRRTIEELARKAYDSITAQQPLPDETGEQYQRRAIGLDTEYGRLARQLSRMLLAPAASQISNKRLLIVAEGALQYIPFSSLPAPKDTIGSPVLGAKKIQQAIPLIVEHEIVMLPSISTLEALRKGLAERQPGNNTIAIFADPVFTQDDPRVQSQNSRSQPSPPSTEPPLGISRAFGDPVGKAQVLRIPRLQSTQIEAEAIAEAAAGTQIIVARDFDANLTRLTSADTALCRIVHLATHGILNNDRPELSGVILSMINQQGQPCDGFLSLNAVYNLKLKADLVVLSACNTGLGKDIRGEGLVGLTRGFMYAGARRVVASLWQVNDIATSRLMSFFYKGLLKDGLQPTAALRAAQIEMWKKDRWKSPFFWAAFHIQGEWNPHTWQ
ncbi:MAG: hypothetical protein V7641_290 [Blastocatellia bacterium]